MATGIATKLVGHSFRATGSYFISILIDVAYAAMCGRYASFHPAEALCRTFRTTNTPPDFQPSWNVAPTQAAPVIWLRPETGHRQLDVLQWGLSTTWTKRTRGMWRPFNVLAETVVKWSMFEGEFAQWRCIVPANAYYEWCDRGGRGRPYAIARRDGSLMGFAGMWTTFEIPGGAVIRSFAIITTAANSDVAALNERMPVILEPTAWSAWLGEVAGDPALLLHPPPADTLHAWPVNRSVENTRCNGPGLLEVRMGYARF